MLKDSESKDAKKKQTIEDLMFQLFLFEQDVVKDQETKYYMEVSNGGEVVMPSAGKKTDDGAEAEADDTDERILRKERKLEELTEDDKAAGIDEAKMIKIDLTKAKGGEMVEIATFDKDYEIVHGAGAEEPPTDSLRKRKRRARELKTTKQKLGHLRKERQLEGKKSITRVVFLTEYKEPEVEATATKDNGSAEAEATD